MDNTPDITFIESSHTYINKYGNELISCSKLVSRYKPIFDPKGEIIENCAAKKGVSVEELRKEWDKTRDDACDRGINFHKQAQYWVEHKQIQDGDYKDVVIQLSKIPFKGQLKSETIIANNILGIAGTVDLMDIYDNNKIEIWDFKTNKQLKKKGFFNNKTKRFSKMLHPIEHLDDCNFIHYSLQLEIYGLILEENGCWVGNKTILYINPKTRKLEIHPIMPVRNEAYKIIKHYNQMKNW
jgi:hypothetical protein